VPLIGLWLFCMFALFFGFQVWSYAWFGPFVGILFAG
jgi:hypothetical protein